MKGCVRESAEYQPTDVFARRCRVGDLHCDLNFFGGAMKNCSIGIAAPEGKALIHSGGTSTTQIFGGDQDAFLESMTEAASVVIHDVPANVVAYGVPCQVIREIGDKDAEFYYKDRKLDVWE